jgi:hypothetical protein
MFILELILAAAEICFLVYLIRKGKAVTKEMRKLKLERQSVMNLKEMLEEDFIPEIEARKNKILDEFKEKLYGCHITKLVQLKMDKSSS